MVYITKLDDANGVTPIAEGGSLPDRTNLDGINSSTTAITGPEEASSESVQGRKLIEPSESEASKDIQMVADADKNGIDTAGFGDEGEDQGGQTGTGAGKKKRKSKKSKSNRGMVSSQQWMVC